MHTAPARLAARIAALRRAGAGPPALAACDNTLGNGTPAERIVRDLAQLIDADLAASLKDPAAVVTTMIDRITPRAGPAGRAEHLGPPYILVTSRKTNASGRLRGSKCC
ncbi:MAG: hypothetical protein ACRDOH_13665 [Streptosporangiaceae bacterium]